MRNFVRLFMLSLGLLTGFHAARAEDPAKIATPPKYVHHVESGTIKAACSPWDGLSFLIDLPNTHTVVYSSLDVIEGNGGAVVFEADPTAQKEGMAQITKCEREGKNCKLKNGIVAITTIEQDVVVGVVQISMGGWGRNYNGNESHMFRAKYDRTKPACK